MTRCVVPSASGELRLGEAPGLAESEEALAERGMGFLLGWHAKGFIVHFRALLVNLCVDRNAKWKALEDIFDLRYQRSSVSAYRKLTVMLPRTAYTSRTGSQLYGHHKRRQTGGKQPGRHFNNKGRKILDST